MTDGPSVYGMFYLSHCIITSRGKEFHGTDFGRRWSALDTEFGLFGFWRCGMEFGSNADGNAREPIDWFVPPIVLKIHRIFGEQCRHWTGEKKDCEFVATSRNGDGPTLSTDSPMPRDNGLLVLKSF